MKPTDRIVAADAYEVTGTLKTYLPAADFNRCITCHHIGGLKAADLSGVCTYAMVDIGDVTTSLCERYVGNWRGDDSVINTEDMGG